MSEYGYKSAQSVDAATARKESAPPMWEAVASMRAFRIPYGEEAPKEYQELISNRDLYRVTKQETALKDDAVLIAVWYIKKVGETERPEKAAVKGFSDKNPEATRFSTQA